MKPRKLFVSVLLPGTLLALFWTPGLAQVPSPHPEYDLWSTAPRGQKTWDPSDVTPLHEQRSARHRAFIQNGLPVEYRAQPSPYPMARGVIDDGGQLYARHCKACHGAKGLGDGEAGKDLAPSPALLAYLSERPAAIDGYLLWTLSEGGKPFGTDMPAFKDQLTRREIWQIVAFLRAGLPPATPAKAN